jgi:hypothetical protein
MAGRNRVQSIANGDAADLVRMIGPDEHRPGPTRARLLAEQIPVWAIVGHVSAVLRASDPPASIDAVIARVAVDYDIAPTAVLAALLYYQEHREAIDALLEANAAAVA